MMTWETVMLQDCLREMILPTMQRVYDKVNFTLSFIGEYVESSLPVRSHLCVKLPLC